MQDLKIEFTKPFEIHANIPTMRVALESLGLKVNEYALHTDIVSKDGHPIGKITRANAAGDIVSAIALLNTAAELFKKHDKAPGASGRLRTLKELEKELKQVQLG